MILYRGLILSRWVGVGGVWKGRQCTCVMAWMRSCFEVGGLLEEDISRENDSHNLVYHTHSRRFRFKSIDDPVGDILGSNEKEQGVQSESVPSKNPDAN